MFHKKTALLLVLILVISIFTGCKGGAESPVQESDSMNASELKVSSKPAENSKMQAKSIVRVGALKGPSSLGLLEIMENNSIKKAENIYEFVISGSPEDIQAKLLNKELDIAAVPTNMASVLYNKTDKDISVIAVGTLGILYLLAKDEEITSFEQLEGKTVYASGQGSTLEYVLNFLIDKNNLNGKVDVRYKAEHSELAALMLSGNADIALLPQPFVTTVMLKDPDVKIALDINDEWRKASGNTELTMTCIIARNAFIEKSKAAVDKFLDEYEKSTIFTNENVPQAAELSEKFDIIPKAVAEKAIPKCGIVFIGGDKMKPSVGPFLKVLYDVNPKSIGGALPDDAFYYKR